MKYLLISMLLASFVPYPRIPWEPRSHEGTGPSSVFHYSFRDFRLSLLRESELKDYVSRKVVVVLEGAGKYNPVGFANVEESLKLLKRDVKEIVSSEDGQVRLVKSNAIYQSAVGLSNSVATLKLLTELDSLDDGDVVIYCVTQKR
jgi:hypothetical protein